MGNRTKIKDIVNSIMALKDEDDHLSKMQRYQCLIIAKRGLQQLQYLGTRQSIRGYAAVVDENGRVTPPDNYVDYVRISILGNDGLLYPIRGNPKLDIAWRYINANQNLVVINEDEYTFSSNSNKEASYRWDDAGGFLQFQHLKTNKVIIEFVADPLLGDINNIGVHKFFVETMETYIYYQYIRTKRNVPISEKKEAERRYYNALRIAKKESIHLKKEEILQYMNINRGNIGDVGSVSGAGSVENSGGGGSDWVEPPHEGDYPDDNIPLTDYFSDRIIQWGDNNGFVTFEDYQNNSTIPLAFPFENLYDSDLRGLKYLINTTELKLEGNYFTDLSDALYLTHLQTLDLYNVLPLITVGNFSGFVELKVVSFQNDVNLTVLPVWLNNLPSLRTLDLSKTDISGHLSLEPSKDTLEFLTLNYTAISGICDLSNFSVLNTIYIKYNTGLDTTDFDNLLSQLRLAYDTFGTLNAIHFSETVVPTGGENNPDILYLESKGVTVTF